MTPKEKAQELIEKHLSVYDIEPIAKKCALITVDEIISNRERIKGIDKLYWQQVKNELQEIYEQQ